MKVIKRKGRINIDTKDRNIDIYKHGQTGNYIVMIFYYQFNKLRSWNYTELHQATKFVRDIIN